LEVVHLTDLCYYPNLKLVAIPFAIHVSKLAVLTMGTYTLGQGLNT